jgi:two-component system, NtrC family, sensor kinase
MVKEATRDAAYYRSLTRWIVLIIVGVSIVPLILISGTIRYFFQHSYQEKVLEHLSVLVKKHSERIDSFLNERLADIEFLADSYSFDQLSNESFLKERLKIMQKAYSQSFVDLGVVDDQGIQVAYAGEFELRRANYARAPWLKEALARKTYISDVFPGLRGSPHFIITVRGEHKGAKWVLRATVDFERFNRLVESIRIGETGFAFILNRKGEFQTRPRMEVVPHKDRYLSFLQADSDTGQHVGVMEAGDRTGNDVLYVMSKLKKGDWVLVFQQEEGEAYAALYSARRFTVIIFLLGMSGIVAVAIVLSSRVVKRIKRVDHEKEMMTEKVVEAGKLASLGELAAGIAHEINNPVAVMVEEAGWMQDLMDDLGAGDFPNRGEFQRALNQIRSMGTRCKQITHKLLSFARKTDPTPKKVRINQVVEDCIALCQQRSASGAVRITAELAEDLPTIRIAPTEAQQVLVNLLNNAIDAVEPQGGLVKVTTRSDGDHVIVDVADDGHGIPSYVLPRIFDPFFTTKPVGKGTGLGLSICYGIVRKQGGDITVNTSEGVGTTFHVKFLAPTSERGSQ